MEKEKKELWKKVKKFELEKVYEEYGFLTRLSLENGWTIRFTEDAVLEYKKFMFLAAVSNEMVSPSDIVDTVWHLHLTFSKSYDMLCEILGKKIYHIPATTGKRSEKKSLEKAKEDTLKVYEEYFGTRNEMIWEMKEFEEVIGIKPIDKEYEYIDNGKLILLGGLLLIPVFFIWKPLLLKIGNPTFFIVLAVFLLVILLLIEEITDDSFRTLYRSLDNFYIKKLHKYELIAFIENSIGKLVTYKIDDLLHRNSLKLSEDTPQRIILEKTFPNNDTYERCIINQFKELPYESFSKNKEFIVGKPAFLNIENTVSLLRDKLLKSEKILENTLMISGLLFIFYSFVFSRLILGVLRGKAVSYLVFFIIFSICLVYSYLKNIYSRNLKKYLIQFFKFREKEIDKDSYLEKIINNQEIVLGASMTTVLFANKLNIADDDSSSFISSSCISKNSDSSNSSSSSCSSCSGCGGCGGG
ncbi:conserved membrane hypothetical protein [Tenacibaculum maritimum]|uniref:hypothetical protein n=1 Tax=Tenacibaculum maritimum TaxID=107401 RepID=UPI0012E6043D|nr:hypothetical protein [Tenacibaculum maritimum]CAA0150099.1 conserved membrane hypothetical protein [Tenacibaculum maritimum]CAA0177649.1 conserved membrane hypothetical protein [Tenacibaculum maritimum]